MNACLIFLGVWSLVALAVAPLIARLFRTPSSPVTVPGREAASPAAVRRDDAVVAGDASQTASGTHCRRTAATVTIPATTRPNP
jgi:hypothetical protein